MNRAAPRVASRFAPRALVLLAMAATALVRPVSARPLVRAAARAVGTRGLNAARLARIDSIIEAAIRDGATPGAAIAIGRRSGIVRLQGYGRIDWADDAAAVTDSTLYDLASLTKVVGTTTAAMMLVQQKRLLLDAPLRRYLPQWPRTGSRSRITIRQLLMHTSGLPAGADLWWVPGSRAERVRWIATRPLVSRPGTRTLYSDLGMIVLGAAIEHMTHERLDAFLDTRVYRPLGMRDTRFNPLAPLDSSPFNLARIAPTELDQDIRHTHLHGEVQDLNAAALEGVAGHAGLFSSARDLGRFALEMLRGASGRDTELLRPSTVRRFLAHADSRRPLGWDAPRTAADFSRRAFGHTGFTGTSIWIDPDRNVFVVLLTNRVDPTAANTRHLALRRAISQEIRLAADEGAAASAAAASHGSR